MDPILSLEELLYRLGKRLKASHLVRQTAFVERGNP